MKYEKLALDLVEFSRELFPGLEFIPLHAPQFSSEEERLLVDTVRSTFVSTVGEYVGEFERLIESFTSAKFAVAMNSGTAALHIALLVSGVSENDEVLTQPVTFVATGNAIRYCGAVSFSPVFVSPSDPTRYHGKSDNSARFSSGQSGAPSVSSIEAVLDRKE